MGIRVHAFTIQNLIVFDIDPPKIENGRQKCEEIKTVEKSQKSVWVIKFKRILLKLNVVLEFGKVGQNSDVGYQNIQNFNRNLNVVYSF